MRNVIESVTKYPTFRLVEVNPRRAQRGKESVRVEVTYSSGTDDSEWLWMSASDVRANIAQFGECEELRKALAAYS
jgi:chlorite dismutase